MIVSPAPFTAQTGTPVVLPVTTGGSSPAGAGSLDDAGTRSRGVIRCNRPRVLDPAARNGKGLEAVPEAVMDEVIACLAAILA